jgi:F-type H+-transporting ATPase subunit a
MQLIADAAGKIPEIPNFITLLHDLFPDSNWVNFLHHRESIIYSVLIASFICLIFHFGTRHKELIPRGFQNFLELLVESMQKIIYGILGEDGPKYFPFLATLFIYILSMNLFGLVPFMKSPSSNLNVTVGLAICVFALVQYLNFRNMGFFGFLYHLAGSPKGALGWAMTPLMFPVEVITQLSRPVTLSLRLFGNILGEKILIGIFTLFGIAMVAFINSPVGFPLQTPFMLFALLTGLMQALIFTLLSAVYIVLSIPHEDEKHQ